MDGRELVRQFSLQWLPTGRDNELVESTKLAAMLRAILEEVKKNAASISPTNMVSFKESAIQMNTIVKRFEVDKTKCYKDLLNNQEQRGMIEDFIAKISVILGAPNPTAAKKLVPEKPRPASVANFGTMSAPGSPVMARDTRAYTSSSSPPTAAPGTPTKVAPLSPFASAQPQGSPAPGGTSSPASALPPSQNFAPAASSGSGRAPVEDMTIGKLGKINFAPQKESSH